MSEPNVTSDAPSPLPLPDQPNLRHLKDQARDLLKSGGAATITEAQFRIARKYGYPSWPKLKSYVEALGVVGELKTAIDSNDFSAMKRLMTRHQELHAAKMGYAGNGPLTWVAECRVPRVAPDETRLAMARWMIENGSDIHQGGDGPLMRAALDDDRIAMMELLVRYGADVNALWGGHYPIILAPCESLAPGSLRWLLQHGANPTKDSHEGTPLSMLVGTYSRNAAGKHGCLEALDAHGFHLPDTPIMAVHRGRTDLLARHLERDPKLLIRCFSDQEIFPREVGLTAGQGLTSTPLSGTTLLHMASEYGDLDLARRLVDQGADPNARAEVDAEGFGGQTPLYHTLVAMGARTDAMAHVLLEAGADPNIRSTFRKQLASMGEPEEERMFEFRDVTPIGYALAYQEPAWANVAAIELLRKAGGV